MLWCALVLPDLALQIFTRGRSEAAPLAILGPRPQLRVVAANPAAMACGVEPGISRASALALVPQLHLQERAPALESAALAEIANWAGRFTSSISLDPP
ncbi:MAG TPA: DNA polymerase Y family protein, partial [Zoogloea sp.]|nr:DNA polymerase Y family protein [Zoogloea sp.]